MTKAGVPRITHFRARYWDIAPQSRSLLLAAGSLAFCDWLPPERVSLSSRERSQYGYRPAPKGLLNARSPGWAGVG
jgi:hypothetical protein